ncbi:cupin [Billgrantia gudaonensis]|uniref:Cupin n=1 Tax=Billgrantia gudaonensis TaxID=376427 RepID=A0A3S0NF63_9GAMM|nr:cupin [Halomonas gudaonensis]
MLLGHNADGGAPAGRPYRSDGHASQQRLNGLEWGGRTGLHMGEERGDRRHRRAHEQKPSPFTIRCAPGRWLRDPPAYPSAYERVTVLSGTLHFASEVRGAPTLEEHGFAIMAPGDPMFGYAEGETVIQLHGAPDPGASVSRSADDPRN